MEMKNLSSTALLLALLITITGMMMREVKGECQYLFIIDGGCPDLKKCAATCAPCYVGKGRVFATCFYGARGQPVNECRCYFLDGAPCPPIGGPNCPKPPLATFVPQTSAINGNLHFNRLPSLTHIGP